MTESPSSPTEAPESTSSQRFRLSQFEGPLDLLLFLIRRSEINIHDIPIAEITEQYLAFLAYETRIDLERATEFYVLASTLLYIKSRMLLPTGDSPDEDDEDPRSELVARLIEYQKYKRLSELMSDREEQADWTIERAKQQRVLHFPETEDLWEQLDVWDLLNTFSRIMTGLTPQRIIDLYEEVSINEKLTLIAELLNTRGEFLFTDLISQVPSKMEIVCAFLAILESVKRKMIRIYQNRLFGDIRIRGADPTQAPEQADDGP